ncbi:myb-like protein F [Cydia splendana]|uniref:myb-like protein F n=1 Tax=Cydia splendana TaxID=1100963 RepID=UPI00300C5C24
MLESKLESELDTDNLKQSVLEGVKKLLDSKLSSLAKNGDRNGSDGIPKQRLFKPKSRMRPISNRKVKTHQESNSSEEDSQNSEFVKVLTDDSNQDPGDEELRDAVDELLEENKNNDEVILDERTPDAEQLTDYNSDEKISKDSYDDITTQVVKNSKRYRKGNKIDHRKNSNSVIVESLRKIYKKDDDGNNFKVISDKKLKSTLKDTNGYGLEHANDADGISAKWKTKQVRNNIFSNRRNKYFKSRPYITKYSQKPHKVDNLKVGEGSKVDGINYVSYDENVSEMETPTSSHQDKNGNNDEINTLRNSTDKNFGFRRKLLKNNLKQSSKKGKDLLDFSESEKQDDSYEDILDKLIKEDIETEINENQNQELIDHKEKPKRKLGKHHNNYRRIGRDKLEKNYNDKYERISKPKLTDLTVTNDLIDSKESWLDSILNKKETQKETHHNIPLKLGKLDGENQKQAESYDSRSSISKENSYNEELNDTINGNNFDEDNGIIKDIAYEEKEHDFQYKDFVNNKKKANKVRPDERKDDKRIQEDIKFRNEEDLTKSDNDVTSRGESVMGKYLKDGEDDIFENEDDITERDSDVTYINQINSTGKKKHITKNKPNTEEGISVSKKGKNNCREKKVESDETKIIRDLIENKEVKKSFSFSLNFISQ